MKENNAQQCLQMCPLFEAELLLELMFRFWSHPYADDSEYRSNILESATELLERASDPECEEVFFKGMPSQDMNLVSAVWYVEWNSLQHNCDDRESRNEWLPAASKSKLRPVILLILFNYRIALLRNLLLRNLLLLSLILLVVACRLGLLNITR